MQNENEIWKDVPGYEDRYKVSNLGRVIRKQKITKMYNHNAGRITDKRLKEIVLKGTVGKDGYCIVELIGGDRFGVHMLVLLAFVGPAPEGMYTRHLDGNRLNNNLDNLRWDTPTANNRDKILHGTITKGVDVCTAKLTENEVREIRDIAQKAYREGMRFKRGDGVIQKLADRFNVSVYTIFRVFRKESWKHVE